MFGKKKGYMQKKRLITAAALLAVLVFLLVDLCHEMTLDRAQRDFIALLEQQSGNYNEDRVVLSSTTKDEAEEMAEEFGGSLRITEDGSFAVIHLREGMTLSDIAENRDFRKYHDRILLDYNNFCISEGETDGAAEVRANYQVNDPMYPQQTYLDYLNIGDTWTITRGAGADGGKVTIAIIDTGIDTDHPEFQDADGNSIISTKSYDATNDKVVDQYNISVIEDIDGHGTAVAGVIAAQMDETGIAGLAPDVELLIIKCETDEAGEFKSSADIVFAIYYAIEQDVDIINMSLGGGGGTDMKEALQLAVDSDIICIAAAGNDSSDYAHYPAAYDTVIGVGALADGSWEKADYSNYGVNSDIMAPGTALTAAIGGGYTYQNGTSMSAPMVTAAAALYVSQNKYVTCETLKAHLLASGRDLGDPGEDIYYGFGALDIHAFVCEEKGTITYDYCTEEIAPTAQVFIRKHTIQTVPEPERESIVFDNWYYDKAYTRVFDYETWYSTEFVEDVTLYAKWVNEDDEDVSVYNYRTLSDGTIEIVSYKGQRRYLIIPDSIDGKTVSSIGASAFAGNTRLREVTFPKGLVFIKTGAFSGDSQMRKIIFNGTVLKEIQDKAFWNCSALRTLDLPDSVQTIGEYAFSGCSAMTSVSISENSVLTSLGGFAFSRVGISYFYLPQNVADDGFDASVLAYSSNMRGISVHPENSAFTVSGSTLYNADKTELVYYPAALTGSFAAANGLERIGRYAFAGSSVSGVELNSVVTIGEYAFESAKNLSSVVLPDTVTSLGASAFMSSSVSQVTLSENLTEIAQFAFCRTKLTSVRIPAKVQTVQKSAFSSCSYLNSLTFAEDSELQVIADSAFEGCYTLGNFVLPESLTTIGQSAFSRCSSLTKLTIPAGVSSIGEMAFRYCTLLQQVDFASDCVLTAIPGYCFANCTALNTVNFSDGITTLGQYAFSNCRLLSKLNFSQNSGLTTVGTYCFYSCSALQTLQLPQSVTTIGQFAYAFSGLKQVEIMANVRSVGNAAFGACYSLSELTVDGNNTVYAAVDNVLFNKNMTTVYCVPASRTGSYTLPETVTVTAPYSFYYDQFLTAVILPDGLEDIQQNSFYSCSSLTGVEIPANVTNIGRQAFENCYKLTSVAFGAGSKLQRLGIYTFVSCGFQEITIPASVEGMAQYVFYNCGSLKKITFEANSKLSYIAAYLFRGTKVESISFEEGSALTSLQAHAFDGASYLRSVDFGDAQLTNVDNYAFYNCAKLESISLPATVTYIGRYAFYGCALLDRMNLPAAVDFIGQSAFYGTDNIKLFFAAESLPANVEADWDKGIAGYFLDAVDYIVTDEWEYSVTRNNTIALALYKGTASELTIDTIDGYTAEKIGTRCFYNNDNLTSVTLSDRITEIGNYAFADCDALTAITVPASVKRIGKYAFADSSAIVSLAEGSGLETMDDYAFSGNATTGLTLPDSVTAIGSGAFRGSRLTTLTIGESSALKSIGAQAFVESGLTSVYLPASLETVGAEAFKNVTALTKVTIAQGNTALKLSNSAFEGSGITEVTIPARVYYIGEYTFGSCPNLLNIHVDSGSESYTSLDGVLCDIYGTTLIQYPSGRSGAYTVPEQIKVLTYASFKNAKNLTEVSFAEGSTVRTIGWQTFSGCKSLTKITVPDTVVSFDFYAFENCTSLTDVVLGEETQLTGVYEGAFYGCTALNNITLPDAVVEIGEYAFYNCSALTAFPLTKNAQVKGIYDYAFSGCTGITEIPNFTQLAEIGEYAFAYTGITEYTLPATVKRIESNSFYGCESFTTIYCEEGNEEYVAIDGALYEKGATSATNYDAVVIWPYGKMLIIGEGKTEITAEDTAVIKEFSDARYVIADTVTTIAAKAFYGYTGLKEITLPESVISIGEQAFYGCNSLSFIELPQSVTAVGSNAFPGCIVISYAEVLPEEMGTNWLGAATLVMQPKEFGNTEDGFFYCLTNDNAAVIGKYSGTKATVTIPGSIKGHPVTQLAGTFNGHTLLKNVSIPDSVSVIGGYSFYNCSALTKIELPAKTTEIGAYAFYGTNLKELTIPEGVERIGNYAFYNRTASKILGDTTGLEHIYFNATDMDDCVFRNHIFGWAWGNNGPVTVTIGKNVTRIPAYLFYLDNDERNFVSDIIFEEGSKCTSIGECAFAYNSGLQEVSIPEGVTSIERSAFTRCTSLSDVTLPEGLVSIGNYAFSYTDLSDIAIPGTVTTMGQNTFEACELTSAGPVGGGYDLEFGWTDTIPAYAFYGSALESIVIPDGVTKIGTFACGCCSNLTDISLPDSISVMEWGIFQNCKGLTCITIPESVTSLSDLFFQNKQLTVYVDSPVIASEAMSMINTTYAATIAINENCRITDTTLIGNYSLTEEITYSGKNYLAYSKLEHSWSEGAVLSEYVECEQDGVTRYTCETCGLRNEDVVSAHDYQEYVVNEATCFKDGSGFKTCSRCGQTVEYTIPSIGYHAFGKWYTVEEATEDSPGSSRRDCEYCDYFELGDFTTFASGACGLDGEWVITGEGEIRISGIGDMPVWSSYANVPWYDYRNSITSITIDDAVTDIGKYAFYGCVNLTNVIIPGNIANIGDYAFSGCTKLTNVTISNGVARIGYGTFRNCSVLKSIEIPPSVNTIAGSAFYQCKSLTQIVIPFGVTAIYSNTFYYCTSLTSVQLPESLTSIGEQAFFECTMLRDIAIPDSVATIGYSAFSGCKSLTNISIPKSVTSLSQNVFSKCTGLTSITIPESVTQIDNYAFNGCTGLISVIIPRAISNIGIGIFYNCSNLANIDVVTENLDYCSIDGVLFDKKCTTLVTYPEAKGTSYIVPDTVVNICDRAFWGCTFTELVFKGDAPSFGENTFYKATATIYYPANNDTWTEDVKQGCSGTLTWIAVCDGHVWGDWYVTQAPTCTETGEEQRNCQNCDIYEIREIAPLGHDYQAVVTDPTCEEKGYTTHTCANCGDSYVDSYVDALGHNFGEWTTIKAATCTENGEQRRDCSRCDYYETQTMEASGHSWDEGVITLEPAEDVEGEMTYTCTVCGGTRTESIPATGHTHSYQVVVTDPTCTEQGYTTHTCAVCGNSYVDSYVDALGHSWDDGVIMQEPTETAEGVMRYTCTVCGAEKTESIPATGHTHSYQAVVTDPTCTEQGYTTHTCSVCGDSYVDTYVDALGHALGQWATTVEATCIRNGEQSRNCSRCGYSETRTTETGEHSWDEGTVTRESTEEAEGEMLYTCTLCGATRTESIPVLGHVHHYEAVVTEPTCTERGYTTYTCAACGDSYVDAYVDALGHALGQWETTVEAACTANGEQRRDCSRCDYYETQSIAALGHSWDDGVVSRQPTTEEEGEITYTCGRCGETRTESVPKLTVTWTLDENGTLTISGTGTVTKGAWNAEAVKAVVIGAGITELQAEVFQGCTNLTRITFLGSAPEIGEDAFAGISATVVYPADDATWKEADLQDYGGTITWTPEKESAPNAGDFSGDGIVNEQDAACLLWHALFKEEYPVQGNADLNGDGCVDESDVVYLLWHLLFPDKFPL